MYKWENSDNQMSSPNKWLPQPYIDQKAWALKVKEKQKVINL